MARCRTARSRNFSIRQARESRSMPPSAIRSTSRCGRWRRPVSRHGIRRGAAAGRVERLDSLRRRAARLGIAAFQDLDDATAARFRDAMDHDFGTPEALAAIFDAVTAANRALDDEDVDRATALIETVTTLTGV